MTSRKVGLRRLLRLADHIETVDPKRFDMRTWSGLKPKSYSCGTVGCIAGHAAEIPSLRRTGYHLDYYGYPTFRGITSVTESLGSLFCLDYSEYYSIFQSKTIKTPKQAARHLREFVKQATDQG